MMRYFKLYLASLAAFFAIDMVWLGLVAALVLPAAARLSDGIQPQLARCNCLLFTFHPGNPRFRDTARAGKGFAQNDPGKGCFVWADPDLCNLRSDKSGDAKGLAALGDTGRYALGHNPEHNGHIPSGISWAGELIAGCQFAEKHQLWRITMQRTDRKSLITFLVVVGVGFLVALAGSQGGIEVGGIPWPAGGIGFFIEWIAYIPAFQQQTEKFYDITGSLTYISVTSLALLLSPNGDARAVLWSLVVVWAFRLGSHLFRRIRKSGKDDRFDEIKPSWIRFLNAWTIQALWIAFTVRQL